MVWLLPVVRVPRSLVNRLVQAHTTRRTMQRATGRTFTVTHSQDRCRRFALGGIGTTRSSLCWQVEMTTRRDEVRAAGQLKTRAHTNAQPSAVSDPSVCFRNDPRKEKGPPEAPRSLPSRSLGRHSEPTTGRHLGRRSVLRNPIGRELFSPLPEVFGMAGRNRLPKEEALLAGAIGSRLFAAWGGRLFLSLVLRFFCTRAPVRLFLQSLVWRRRRPVVRRRVNPSRG